jgi:hypothetical protein
MAQLAEAAAKSDAAAQEHAAAVAGLEAKLAEASAKSDAAAQEHACSCNGRAGDTAGGGISGE